MQAIYILNNLLAKDELQSVLSYMEYLQMDRTLSVMLTSPLGVEAVMSTFHTFCPLTSTYMYKEYFHASVRHVGAIAR